MIEIFLFVNPLDKNCLEVARSVCRFPKNRSEKVNIRLITYGFNKIPNKNNQPCINSSIINAEYLACLSFQAASMQGKKKGNLYFINLQSLLFEKNYEFSEETIMRAAEEVNIDLEIFKEDLYSNLAKNSYQRDKQLAKDMNVNTVPLCIIYYHNHYMNKARVEDIISDYTLHYACNTCYGLQAIDPSQNITTLK